jgi:hypothetical protein
MATFEPINNRIEFRVSIQAGFTRRYVTVIDAGWEIRLIDDERNPLYVFSTGSDVRKADKASALEALQRRCGWWASESELFTNPPKPPTARQRHSSGRLYEITEQEHADGYSPE